MRTREQELEPFVNLSELNEIELLLLRHVREYTMGEHRAVFHGHGFDLVGVRDWQPGDPSSSIDWAQSSITNFTPLIVRDFEQSSTGTVIAIADNSLSTRCGTHGTPIVAAVARALGVLGMSAVFFQDTFGVITFDAGFKHLAAVRPRTGKSQVIHCLDAYQNGQGTVELNHAERLSLTLGGFLRKTALVPVISDFLFDDAPEVIAELALLDSAHDVFLVLIDSAFAYELPVVSAGWVEAFDIETGRTRVLSRSSLRTLATRTREWQDEIVRIAKAKDLDVVRLGLDEHENTIALGQFTAERRLRKK
jgi:uncharacterized protein (DUF58 family)